MAIKPNKRGVVTGTKKNDKITWLSSKDWAKAITVNAGAGNDIINFKKSKYKNKLNGDAGNDVIYGGANIDNINGGIGNDKLYGYNGNDVIYAGKGNDSVYGGKGNDKIYGQYGTNKLYAEDGNDYIKGGTGVDYIYAGKGNDTVKGGAGNDKIYGQYGTNKLYGEDGNDAIKGGTGVDYIYAGNGNDTVKGGAGNDKIYGQYGKNKLYGEDGNDAISGGTGTDYIYGGTGNDTINAGAGLNFIYHAAGDGNDIVKNGGDTDTLVFNGEASIDSLNAMISGNDVVITRSNGETVTLKNYVLGDHSTSYVQVGDTVVETEEIKNHINSDEQIVNGTDWGDDIKTSFTGNLFQWAKIYAGAGDDIIRITNDSDDFTEVNVGTGNDTISFEADDANVHTVDIYFNKGDGNNTITGLTDDIGTQGTRIYLNSPDLIKKVSDIGFISGNRSGDDLVLNVDGGETFTIKDYYTLNSNAQTNIEAYLNSEDDKYDYEFHNDLKMLVYSSDEIIQTGAGDAMPDLTGDHKLMIVQKNGVAPTLDGNYNTYAQEGNGTQYATINGNSNRVYLTNTGTNSSTDKTTIDVYGNYNTITTQGGGMNRVDMTQADGLIGNVIYFHHGDSGRNNNYVWTSVGGANEVNTYTTDNVNEETAECSVWSLGNDYIELIYGTNYVDFLRYGEEAKSDKTVKAYYETHNKILNATEANSIDIINRINGAGDRETTDVMFEHYTSNRSGDDDYISLAAKDSNGNIYTTADLDIDIYGSWETGTFDLDNAVFANNVNVEVGTTGFVWSKKLSEMNQLIYMSKVNNNYAIDSGILTIANGVAVQGTASDDTYTVSDISALTTQYTLTEKGGDDTISIAGSNNFRLFFDVDTNGDFGNDLYIFQTIGSDAGDYDSELSKFLREGKHDEANYICIKNANLLPSAEVERIVSAGTSKYIGTMGYINAIKENIESWLNTYNTDNGTSYDTVLEAIQNNAGNNSLFNAYTVNANDAWTANLYNV